MKKNMITLLVLLCAGVLFTGCKGSDYKKAIDLQEAGSYQEALDLYEKVGAGYKDTAERILDCQAYIEIIGSFNNTVADLERDNAELDALILKADELIKGSPALDETLVEKTETAVSNAKSIKLDPPEMATDIKGIEAQVENMKSADYDTAIEDLKNASMDLEISQKRYALVDNPDEAYVIKCLGKVDHVVDISAVTEDNDPNGKLGKKGGYTATVYFTSDLVDQSNVYGSSVIDKGTDGGGAVEVYANAEDAKARSEYLGLFDTTAFVSGSHTVIGTCLVRTSDELTGSQQQELEKNIIDALTGLDSDSEKENVKDPKKKKEQSNDTEEVTPSFKETMDKYEAFFDEYVETMNSIANGSSLEALANYGEFLSKYTQYMEELERIEETKDDLSKADLEYYIEVNARIQKKMLSVIEE